MKRPFILFLFFVVATTVKSQIPIWQGTAEYAPHVTLEPFLPIGTRPSTAIIICPGGSYHWLDMQTEGVEVARWLQANGIAAFVLRYRVAGVAAFITHYRLLTRGHRHPDMLRDVQRALQLVRERAAEWNVDTARVGVMGFSAGGHLAMVSAAFAATNFLAPLGIYPAVSLHPDFVAPLYPVVTLADKRYVHRRSRRGLLGEWGKGSRCMRDSLSLEKHIPTDCPPVFLMNCVDDPVVKYQNAVLLDSALTAHEIPHLYIQYRTGGHGFGASKVKGTAECRGWRTAFLSWLHQLFP